jgi:hypothetical protein
MKLIEKFLYAIKPLKFDACSMLAEPKIQSTFNLLLDAGFVFVLLKILNFSNPFENDV